MVGYISADVLCDFIQSADAILSLQYICLSSILPWFCFIVIIVIGDARVATALTYVMGEKGLLNNGEYFIIGVDVTDPYNPEEPYSKTVRE